MLSFFQREVATSAVLSTARHALTPLLGSLLQIRQIHSATALHAPASPQPPPQPTKQRASPTSRPGKVLGLKDVKHIIAVSSAKGGVGKSTTAVNLAVALATSLRLKVGLLDADVHGPSIGMMMKLSGEPEVSKGPQPLIVPKQNHGVRTMSFAFFVKEGAPVALRGPMVNSAFDKMATGTDWGPLDVLVVDMPPGTGDAQINLGQRIPLSGAIIVSTPQDIALLDARRGIALFQKLHVPLLGLVENMSHHQCSSCGHTDFIFGEGGAVKVAQEMGLKVLGQMPLTAAIRLRSDSGAPVVVSEPESSSAKAYVAMARTVYEALGESAAAPQAGPRIVFE